MKKILLFTVISFFVSACAFSQTVKIIDSLEYQLRLETQDTNRVWLMTRISLNYRLLNPDSGIYYGQRSVELADKIQFYRGKVTALGFESMSFSAIGNLPKALELGLEALHIAKVEPVGDATSAALNIVGGIYDDLKDYPKALYYERQMLQQEIQKHSNAEALAYAESAIGGVFLQMAQLDSAGFYLQKAFVQFQDIDPSVGFADLGVLAEKKGNYPKAMAYYQQSLHITIREGELSRTSGNYDEIANLYQKINQPDSATYYASKELKIAEQFSLKKLIFKAANLLAKIYQDKNPKEALRYYKMAAAAKDSVYGATNIQALETIISQANEREKDIAATKRAYEIKMQRYAFITGIVILLVIAFILYRNNRQKQKTNSLLANQKEKVENTLSELKSTQSQLIQQEKMASLGELTAGIAHEIQNPLNFVNNFSEVNKEMIDELQTELKSGNTEEAIAISNDIKENEDKIIHHGKRADAIVKGMLQHSRSSTGAKEPTDINALADEYLRLSYHGLRAKDKDFNADIKTDFDESIGKINIVPQDIGRVLLNLFNNAFYAVGEQKKRNPVSFQPTVSVSTEKSENSVIITVSDNGNGIPTPIKEKIFQPFFTTKPTGSGTGLGLSLSYDIIKAHGGEIKVESKENEGTTFTIQLPV
jgi:signal transduction histidine kinase